MTATKLRVKDSMTREPRAIPPTASVLEAYEAMMSGNYRHLPVVDGPKTVGIVSERDLLAHMPPTAKGSVANSAHGQYLARPVGEIMTSGPITVNEDASLDAALELMLVNQVGTVLVVDAGGKLSGIVTVVDVAATLLRLLRGEPELAANA